MFQAMATKAEHIRLNVGVVSRRRSGDVAATPVEEKNMLESREGLARGEATQAAILTKPREHCDVALEERPFGENGYSLIPLSFPLSPPLNKALSAMTIGILFGPRLVVPSALLEFAMA
nr:hypothetical protein CFP56_06673 [Quercus suber]